MSAWIGVPLAIFGFIVFAGAVAVSGITVFALVERFAKWMLEPKPMEKDDTDELIRKYANVNTFEGTYREPAPTCRECGRVK